MKIIDADKLHYKTVRIATEKGAKPALVVFAKEIQKMPAIPQIKVQVDPVMHGHWVKSLDHYDKYMCSACGHLTNTESDNYCSHCGAKMDGVGYE